MNGGGAGVTMTHVGCLRFTGELAAKSALIAVVLAAGGCDEEAARPGGAMETECVGAKCDTPSGEGSELCEGRRNAAFTNGKEAFTPTSLRWSCNDVPGVTAQDRGQEYCEYWALLRTESNVHQLGRVDSDGRSELPVSPDLTDDELFYLEEAEPDDVVGACVFSSWKSGPERHVLGLRRSAGPSRRRRQLPSQPQVQHAGGWPWTSWSSARTVPRRPTACGRTRSTGAACTPTICSATGWRKSDATICSAAVQMAECSCRLTSGAPMTDLGRPDDPGFVLGSWESEDDVPDPCHYIRMDDAGSKVLVACEITAREARDNMHDLKQWCREGYGERIVVHVPVDPSAVECDGSCGETPWVLTDG